MELESDDTFSGKENDELSDHESLPDKSIEFLRRSLGPQKNKKGSSNLPTTAQNADDTASPDRNNQLSKSDSKNSFHPILQNLITKALASKKIPSDQVRLKQLLIKFQLNNGDSENPFYLAKKVSDALAAGETDKDKILELALEPKLKEFQSDNRLLDERARLAQKLKNIQNEVDALTTHIAWNRCCRLRTESSKELEQLLDQLAVNPSFAKIKYPLLLPDLKDQKARLKSLSLQNTACSEASNIFFSDTVKNTNTDSFTTEYQLEGNCFDVEFKLLFFSEKKDSTPKITSLKINLSQVQHQETNDWVQQCVSTCDLVGFFRILSRYASKARARKHVFEELKEKYSLYIHEYITESLIVLYSPRHDWLRLTFFYQLSVSVKERKITDNVELIPKIVDTGVVLNERQTAILLEIPEKFTHLAVLKGISEALSVIVSTLWE